MHGNSGIHSSDQVGIMLKFKRIYEIASLNAPFLPARMKGKKKNGL